MCLIIHREAGRIPTGIIEHASVRNPDGFGIAWRERRGNVQVERFAPENKKQFLRRLDKVNRFHTETVVHFRLATHGSKTLANCHPFEYEDADGNRILMFHNGVLNSVNPDKQRDQTDSEAFAEVVLRHLPYGWWNNATMRWLVEGKIGWSRILLMTQKETVRFQGYNEKWIQRGTIGYSAQPDPPIITPQIQVSTQRHYSENRWLPYEGNWNTGAWVGKKMAEEDAKASTPKAMVLPDAGHEVNVTEVRAWGNNGDRVGEAVCRDCGEFGEFFQIGGRDFIDIIHDRDTPHTNEDVEELWQLLDAR